MTDRQINFVFGVRGEDRAAAALRDLDRAQESVRDSALEGGRAQQSASQRAREAEQRQRQLSDALSTQIAGWGSLGGAVGQVGSVVGRVSPRFQGLADTLGSLGATIPTVATAFASPSPASITTALVSVAATVADGIRAWTEYRAGLDNVGAELSNLKAEADSARVSFDSLSAAIRTSFEIRSRQTSVDLATGNAADQEAEVRRRQALLERARAQEQRAIESRATAFRDPIEAAEDQARATRKRREAEENLERAIRARDLAQREALEIAEEENALAAERDAEQRRREAQSSRGRGGRRGPSRQDQAAISAKELQNRAFLEEQAAMEGRAAAQAQAEAAEQARIIRDQEARQRLVDEAMRNEERMHEEQQRRMAEATRRRLEREQEERERILEESQRQQQAVIDDLTAKSESVLGPVVQGLTSGLAEIIAGTTDAGSAFEGLLSSFLEAIAQMAVIEAAKNFAAAIGALAQFNYASAGLHLAAGAAWTGVAIAAGAGAVATAPAEASAAAPQAPRDPAAESGGGGTVIYNVNGPVISADGPSGRARAGRELGSVIDAGARRFGRAA